MNQNLNLNGLNPLAYVGVNAYTPPPFVNKAADPTATDYQNFYIGSIWLNTATEDVWMLVAKAAGVSTWVKFTGSNGSLLSLSDTAGTKVFPLLNNIQLVGTSPLTVTSDPGNNLLTFALSGSGVVGTLTGNSGGAVSPTAGNIDILGSGVITVVGNPGTSTLTITPSSAIADSFPTDSGTAVPSAGALQILGGSGINTSGSGNTVTVNADGFITQTPFPVQLEFGGSSTGITATTSSGYYAKNGNVVTFNFLIDLTSKGAQTGAATVTGFPVPFLNYPSFTVGRSDNITFAGNYLIAYGTPSATSINISQAASGNPVAALTDAAFANNSQLWVSGSYVTLT